ncbi:MAG: hypothetical protein CM15mP9_1950 [Methanobacteriota archaeon]|nr:MAG: hypothetical protein CM15mP9_1950 [Euryarchaeota archaeon]
MGWIDLHSGDSTWNIMIRTLEARYTTEGWRGTVVAGGGITIESNPESEVAEAVWKAAALRRACGWLSNDTKPMTKGELGIYPIPRATEIRKSKKNSTCELLSSIT